MARELLKVFAMIGISVFYIGGFIMSCFIGMLLFDDTWGVNKEEEDDETSV